MVKARIGLYLCITALLSSCAYASRNVYRPPTSRDFGTITVVNASQDFLSSLWVSYDSDTEGSAKAAWIGEGPGERSVSALHQENIWLSVGLMKVALGHITTTGSCQQAFQIPFSSGDIKIRMSVDKGICKYQFFTRSPGGEWKGSTDINQWGEPLPIQ
jgi:hypothetical protein